MDAAKLNVNLTECSRVSPPTTSKVTVTLPGKTQRKGDTMNLRSKHVSALKVIHLIALLLGILCLSAAGRATERIPIEPPGKLLRFVVYGDTRDGHEMHHKLAGCAQSLTGMTTTTTVRCAMASPISSRAVAARLSIHALRIRA